MSSLASCTIPSHAHGKAAAAASAATASGVLPATGPAEATDAFAALLGELMGGEAAVAASAPGDATDAGAAASGTASAGTPPDPALPPTTPDWLTALPVVVATPVASDLPALATGLVAAGGVGAATGASAAPAATASGSDAPAAAQAPNPHANPAATPPAEGRAAAHAARDTAAPRSQGEPAARAIERADDHARFLRALPTPTPHAPADAAAAAVALPALAAAVAPFEPRRGASVETVSAPHAPAGIAEAAAAAWASAAPVDAGVRPTAGAAPVHQATLASRPQEAGFPADLTAEVRVMVEGGLQQAELRLNPVELGPIQIQLNISSQTADITFAAEHSLTREGISQSLGELRDMLASQGLSLGQTGVGAGTDHRNAGERAADAQGQRASGGAHGGTGRGDGTAPAGAQRAERVLRGMLDLYA